MVVGGKDIHTNTYNPKADSGIVKLKVNSNKEVREPGKTSVSLDWMGILEASWKRAGAEPCSAGRGLRWQCGGGGVPCRGANMC